MRLPQEIARHLREVYFGGNWTAVNLKTELGDVDWCQATTKVQSLNTIADLVFHLGYYVQGVTKVLEGGPLKIRDKSSFDLPQIRSEEDWKRLMEKTWSDAERFGALIEQLQEEKLGEVFVEAKYGSYYKNLHGIIEHIFYHLGQIVLIKKLLPDIDPKESV